MKSSAAIFLLLIFLSIPVPSSAESGNQVYNKQIVKNRSAIGFTNSGTAIYNYQVHDEYKDGLSDEEKGNFELTGGLQNVREIYNHIEVIKPISTSEEEISLGNIKANSGRRVNVINNRISVKGDISGKTKGVSLGAVKIIGSRVRRINNHVTVSGGLNVD